MLYLQKNRDSNIGFCLLNGYRLPSDVSNILKLNAIICDKEKTILNKKEISMPATHKFIIEYFRNDLIFIEEGIYSFIINLEMIGGINKNIYAAKLTITELNKEE